MQQLICYCTGGLANRVRPLASYAALAGECGRAFAVYWPSDRTCGAHYDELFDEADVTVLSDAEASALRPGHLYGRSDSIENAALVHPTFFPDFVVKQSCNPLDLARLVADSAETVIVLDNTPKFLDARHYFQALSDMVLSKLKIEVPFIPPETLGIHIRLTDFRGAANVDENYYRDELKRIWKDVCLKPEYAGLRAVYLASDEPEAVEIVRDVIPLPLVERIDGERIVRSSGSEEHWLNYDRKSGAVVSAMADVVALSRCMCRIGLQKSTFFKLSRELAVAMLPILPAAADAKFSPTDLDGGFEDRLGSLVDLCLSEVGRPQDIFFRPKREAGRVRFRRRMGRILHKLTKSR